jgi:hypothetical protein
MTTSTATYPNTYTNGRWLRVVEPRESGMTTRRLEVRAKKGDVLLGWIRWYGMFRCYSFLPCEGTVYETDCLGDIVATLNRLNAEHKAKA